MPELPEVETTRRGIATVMPGQTLEHFIVHNHKLRWPIPDNLPETLRNQVVRRCERRGKYLLIEFNHGTQLIHLGMSGSLRRVPMNEERRKHDHAEWIFKEARFLYHDPRRFGAILWHDATDGPVETHPLLVKLGIEPFNEAFNGAHLHAQLRKRSQAIKQVVLSGEAVVGVGNIYASEALFKARIHPMQPANSLTQEQCDKLAQAIKTTLAQAIDSGGSTLRDYVNSTGEPGAYFTLHAAMYERAGLPCPTCQTPITRIVQGQRATYYCATCQIMG